MTDRNAGSNPGIFHDSFATVLHLQVYFVSLQQYCIYFEQMNPIDILLEHELKRTACREGILSLMLESGRPLCENEIKDELKDSFDRTTFYRSFKTLMEKKIIHKIVVDNLMVRYALDNSITHKNNHAHFYCKKCDNVICLDDIPVNEPQVPQGFEASETEIIIKGVCNTCKNSK